LKPQVYLQLAYTDLSVDLLWIVSLILFSMTIILFFISLGMRRRHRRIEALANSYEASFYPMILNYLEEEGSKKKILSFFSGKNLEYAVFEKTVIRLLKSLDGEEVQKLKELLLIEPIYKYHLGQLESNNDIVKVKACNYFRFTQLINPKIVNKLKGYLHSENQLLAFSAAFALMASHDVSIRADALLSIVRKEKISRMGLLEILYKFGKNDNKQKNEEAEALKKIILNTKIPQDNKAFLILGVAEMNYYQLSDFFEDLISKKETYRNHSKMLMALIQAQGELFTFDTSPVIRSCLKHENSDVKKTAIEVLCKFGGKMNLSAIYKMIESNNEEIQKECIKALLNNDISENQIYTSTDTKYHQIISGIIKSINDGM